MSEKLTHEDLELHFQEMLNEEEKPVKIFNYEYPLGDALKKLDRIAFREAFLEWLDYELTEENIIDISAEEEEELYQFANN